MTTTSAVTPSQPEVPWSVVFDAKGGAQAPLETAIVHFSDVLVRARGFGFAGDPFVPALHPTAMDRLALTDADIRDILQKIEDSREDTKGLTDEP